MAYGKEAKLHTWTDQDYAMPWHGWDSASVQVCTSPLLCLVAEGACNSLPATALHSSDLGTVLLVWRGVPLLLCTCYDEIGSHNIPPGQNKDVSYPHLTVKIASEMTARMLCIQSLYVTCLLWGSQGQKQGINNWTVRFVSASPLTSRSTLASLPGYPLHGNKKYLLLYREHLRTGLGLASFLGFLPTRWWTFCRHRTGGESRNKAQ